MAVGDFKGSLTGNATSIGTSLVLNTASGNLNVRVGDLIFVTVGEQTAITTNSNAITDNLHTPATYTETNVGTDNGTATGHSFWKVATVNGTLTSVTVTCNGGTNNGAGAAALYQGPFTSIGANPANAQDISSPFLCPNSGTLPQALSLVIGWGSATGSTSWATASPLRTLDVQIATAAVLKVAIGSVFVNSTSAVQPSFTAGSNPSDDALGTASFNVDTSSTTSYRTSQLTSDPQVPNYYYNQQTRTWLQSGLASIAPPPDTTTYMPCAVDEWPLPTLPPRPDATFTLSRANFTPAATAPPAVAAWPNPTAPTYPNDLRTWLSRTALTIQQQPALPLNQYDWPLPKTVAQPDRAWLSTGAVYLPAPAVIQYMPSFVLEWPLPTQPPRLDTSFTLGGVKAVSAEKPLSTPPWTLTPERQRASDLRTWLHVSIGIPAQPQPFNQYSWPLTARYDTKDRSWFNTVPPQPAAILPRNQYDWPNPERYEVRGLTWLNPSAPYLLAALRPFNQYSWPLPKVSAQPDRTWLGTGAPYQPAAFVTIPSVTTEWPNPLIPVYPASLRTWSNPAISAEEVVEVTYATREPSFAPKWRAPQPQRGWVQGTPLGLLQPTFPQPKNQYDWPTPRRAPPTYGFVQSIPAPLNAPAPARPFNRFDWPLVPAAARANDLDTWTKLVINIPSADRPLNQYDWPLPKTAAQPTQTWTFAGSVYLPAPVVVQYMPCAVAEWPNPIIPPRPDATWLLQGILPAGAVEYIFRMPSFASTTRYHVPQVGFVSLRTPAFIAAQPKPFTKTDWPNPRAYLPTYGFVQSTPENFFPTAPLPKNQYDWPLGRAPGRANELRTWIRLVINIPAAATPFNQYAWPLGRAAERASDLRTWVQQAIKIPDTTQPFNQLSWPLTPAAALAAKTWTVTPLGILSTPAARPFNQFDWPLPYAQARAIDLRTWFQEAINIPAAATPFNRFDWPLSLGTIWRTAPAISVPISILATPADRPFSQYAWPLGRDYDRDTELRTWLRAVINIPAAAQPFNQYAWPLGRDYLRPTFVPPQSTPPGMFSAADRPKNQYDWPLRPGPKWPTFIPPQRTHPGFIPAAALPRNQRDWPLPKGPRWPLFIPPKSTPARFITAQPKPPGGADWPWPKGREYPLSLRSWIVNYTILIPIVVEPPIIPPEPPTPTDPYPYTYPIRHQLDSDYGFRRIRATHKIRGRI